MIGNGAAGERGFVNAWCGKRVGTIAVGLAATFAIAHAAAAGPLERPRANEATVLQAFDGRFVAPRGMSAGRLRQEAVAVLVEFESDPGLKSFTDAGGRRGMASVAAETALSRQVAANKAQQDRFASSTLAGDIPFTELYRVQRVKNAIAMMVAPADVARLRELEGVKRVRVLQKEYPHSAKSVPFVGAPSVWEGTMARPAVDGTGVKIAIIDTGLDYVHADFGGDGSAASYADNDRISNTGINSGLPIFPTAKVVGGHDFAGDAYDADANPVPAPDANPMDCNGHGSHVAGTAAGFGVTLGGATFAGPYDTAIDASLLRIYPGMAPKADLYAYRVFGCEGSTFLTVAAIEQAVIDGVDVINMSLGSDWGGLSDASSEAAEAAALAGVIVVASAGNSGDSYFNLGTPSSARRVISVANSVDGYESVATVDTPGGDYLAMPAGFGPALPTVPPLLTGPLALASPAQACTPPAPGSLTGKIAVVDRGSCNFQLKVINAQSAGAMGVIVVNNRTGQPSFMGGDGSAPPTIPSVMVSKSDGALIKAEAGATATIHVAGDAGDMIDASTSRGPNSGSIPGGAVDMTLKPDIAAPGSNIVSAQSGIVPPPGAVVTGSQAATLSGTSMAAPHVAGLVALLRQLHPSYTVEEIKALAMNGALHDLYTGAQQTGNRHSASRIGAGRIDAVASGDLAFVAYADDAAGIVTLSFPSQIGPGPTSVTRKLRMTNKSAGAITLTPSISMLLANPGITFSVSPAPVNIAAGGSATIDVTMDGDPDASINNVDPTITALQTISLNGGDYPRFWLGEASGYVELDDGGGVKARVPLFVAPFASGDVATDAYIQTGGAASGTSTLNVGGTPVCTGIAFGSPATDCIPSAPQGDAISMLLPFELVAERTRNLSIPATAQLRSIGIGVDAVNEWLGFGIGMWAPNIMPGASTSFVQVTLTGPAPSYDALFTIYRYIASDPGGLPINVVFDAVYDWNLGSSTMYPNPNGYNPLGSPDIRYFQNDVFSMGVPLSALGLTTASTITYFVESYSGNDYVDGAGPFTYHLGAPGVTFGSGGSETAWYRYALADYPMTVNFNSANLAANGSLGALMLHLHNAPGDTQQKVLFAGAAPALAGVFSRKTHGAEGAFNLLLGANVSNPTTEPRAGPAQKLVFGFDKPVKSASAAVTSGTATVGATTASGNEVIVDLTGVTDRQYLTVEVSNVVGIDDAPSGATLVRRVGFLAGDVNQNRVVSVADMGLVHTLLSQTTTSGNFLRDIDASGSIAVADRTAVNANLTRALPAP